MKARDDTHTPRPIWRPPATKAVFPEITVEFLGPKGWEIGYVGHGRPGYSTAWLEATNYANGCEQDGMSVRLTITQPPKG